MSGSRKRMLRIPVGILLVVVALVALLPTATRRTGVLEELRQGLTDGARAWTGGGTASETAELRLTPRPVLRLHGVSLTGTGAQLRRAGVRTQLDSYAIEARHLDLILATGPLLRGEMEVRGVRVAGAVIALRGGVDLSLEDCELRCDGAPWTGEASPVGLVAAAVSHDGDRYEVVTADGIYDAGVLDLTEIRGRRGDGRIEGSCRLDFGAAVPAFEFDATLEDVSAPLLLENRAPDLAGRLTGPLTAAVSGRGPLEGPRGVAAMAAELRLRGGPGELRAADWLAGAAPYVGKRRDLLDLDFERLQLLAELRGGVVTVEKLSLTGGRTDWHAAGAADLGGPLDLKLAVTLPPGFTPELGQWAFVASMLKDAEGRVRVPLAVSGTTVRPAVTVDIAAALGGGGR